MEYKEFCVFLKKELPLNRKERFYTGTVLPALLFHNGVKNLYRFLDSIEGFPHEINEVRTGGDFLFYTEYNLKESAGDRNVGRKIHASTNDTPDLVIEILNPKNVFVIIEAKMFARVSQDELTGQIARQKTYIAEELRKEFSLPSRNFYHIAIVPSQLAIKSTEEYQVINWEFFIEEPKVKNNMFYNYLKFALDNYDDLRAIQGGPSTVKFKMKGKMLYEFGKENIDHWVGREGGQEQIIGDIKIGKWAQKHDYCVNTVKPSKGKHGNWIPILQFLELVDRYRK